MKHLIPFLLFILMTAYSGLLHAQSGITLEASQQYTTFKFTDSQGVRLNSEYSGLFTGSYGAGYRFISDGGFMAGGTVGMRKAGATLVYDNTSYSWNLQYVQAQMGVGFMLKKETVSPFLLVSGYFGYLLRGYQTINNENFNIRKQESLNFTDYGVLANPGAQLKINDAVSAYIELGYLMGIKNLEKDENQKATNLAYSATLGLSFTIE